MGAQDPPDGRLAEPVAQAGEFAVDPAIPGALWSAEILKTMWDQGGWPVASAALTATLVPTPMAVLIVALALAATWALRSTSVAPPVWLLPGARPSPLPGPRLG
jgi:hypothetical protein